MTIYDKTVKGREEIASRCYHLAPRVRSLLVMIDGRHAIEELLPKVAGLGMTEANVQALLDEGFIELTKAGAVQAEAEADPKSASRHGHDHDAEADSEPDRAPEAEALDPATAAEQFKAAYQYYTRTIKPTLGIRGLNLQLKVERAATLDELRDLRITFFEMAVRAKGRPAALQLRRELDEIFGLHEVAQS